MPAAAAAKTSDTVATNIIVFGRGLVADNPGFRLTRASAERVEALVDYVGRNAAVFNSRRGRVVFSGGWAAAAEGIDPPPNQFREGSLMLNHAKEFDIGGEDLARYADSYSEIESDSTLENALRSKETRYFEDISFTPCNPLGLVAHQDHLVRIDYLVRRVFSLPSDAIVHIVAPGADNFSGGLPEGAILLLTRLAFLGARSDASLRRRHQILVTCRHRLRSGHL